MRLGTIHQRSRIWEAHALASGRHARIIFHIHLKLNAWKDADYWRMKPGGMNDMNEIIALFQGIAIGSTGLALFSYCQLRMSRRTVEMQIMELLDNTNNEIQTISKCLDDMEPMEPEAEPAPEFIDIPYQSQEPMPTQAPPMVGIHDKPGVNVIMEILTESPQGFNRLGKLSGLSKSTLSRAIKALDESGHIEKGDNGLWHAHQAKK